MKKLFALIGLLTLLLAVTGCRPATTTDQVDEAGQDSSTKTIETLPPIQVTQTETVAAIEEPTETATEEVLNLLRIGGLELFSFSPPWFDGDLSTAVFVENGLLRIDEPIAPFEPGTNQVMGAATLASFDNFDIAATFNAEGGVCTGVDYNCGNIFASNCIVFDFVDFENMQKFCIDTSALFWNLVAFENGVVAYDSSVQPSDAIHDTGVIYHGGHPIPNEIRLTLVDAVLTGYINGDQVFERDGTGIQGKVGVGCINNAFEEELSNCEVTLILNP